MTRLTTLAAAAALALTGAANADTVPIVLQSTVPLVCGASVLNHTVTPGSPLLIDVQVQQSCNTQEVAHQDITVSYVPNSPAAPADLAMVFDGHTPTATPDGAFTFDNEPFTNTVKVLHITYQGGTAVQGSQLVATITLQVTS